MLMATVGLESSEQSPSGMRTTKHEVNRVAFSFVMILAACQCQGLWSGSVIRWVPWFLLRALRIAPVRITLKTL